MDARQIPAPPPNADEKQGAAAGCRGYWEGLDAENGGRTDGLTWRCMRLERLSNLMVWRANEAGGKDVSPEGRAGTVQLSENRRRRRRRDVMAGLRRRTDRRIPGCVVGDSLFVAAAARGGRRGLRDGTAVRLAHEPHAGLKRQERRESEAEPLMPNHFLPDYNS